MSAKKPDGQKVSEVAPLGLRLKRELKERVRAAADTGNRSMNAEITFLIQFALDEIARRDENARRWEASR